MKTVSLANAKAHLSERVRDAERGQSVVITRHGKPVAAIVPAADVERLERLKAAGPEGGLASLAGGWKGSEELARLIEGSARGDARQPPALD